MDKSSIHKSTSALIVLQHNAGLEIVCQSAVLLIANSAASREKARSAAAEEGCTNRTCFTADDLIYFCRKYTIFTKFYEFMLQKVLKFANYAKAVLV